MSTELNSTQIALLEAIKSSLFGTEPSYPADTDWAEVVKEAKAQTVLGIISPVIPVKDVSVEMGKAKYMRLLFEQDKLIKLLDANDIPCVILKGCAAAQYYPKPYLRAMGDVDFLVPQHKFERTAELLDSLGYKYCYGKDNNGDFIVDLRHIEYSNNGIMFELHHHFSSRGFDIDDILEDAIDRREFHKISGYNIPILPNFENGLVLLGHINQHLVVNKLGFRQIIDWEMYVHNCLDERKWKSVLSPLCQKAGLKKLAINISIMCIKYFGLENCEYFLDELESEDVSDLILNILFKSGNFGNKINSSSYRIRNGSISNGIYNIRKKGFFLYFKEIGVRRWKLFQKYDVLKSFAWIYGALRALRLGLVSICKSKSFKKQIKEGNEKYSLFEKLGIEASNKAICGQFQPEKSTEDND